MGSVFSKPRMPSKSQEQIAAEEAEKERLARSEAEEEQRRLDNKRKFASNLVGRRSLQGTDIEGFTGYRRKQMGSAQPQQSGSIRT
jgi:hypothetical protein